MYRVEFYNWDIKKWVSVGLFITRWEAEEKYLACRVANTGKQFRIKEDDHE